MGRMSRNKGASGERELSRLLSQLFSLPFFRSRQFCGKDTSDIRCQENLGIHWESKRSETFSPYASLEQAINDCGNCVPVVCHRRNHKKWLFVCQLEDLPAICQKLAPFAREGNHGSIESDT
jgi:hypothetical protein